MWWLGVVVQLEGCPTKDVLVAYPVAPKEAPGLAKSPAQLRPAFFWDPEMHCWCSVWQSPQAPEADVQKCFNSHFKRYMGLPRCARVGGVVPLVQAVGTDYIGDDLPPEDSCPPYFLSETIGAQTSQAHTARESTLPPLAAMAPQPTPLPPMPALNSFQQANPPVCRSDAIDPPSQPPLKKLHMGPWDDRKAPCGALVVNARGDFEPATMLRSHSGSISASHHTRCIMPEAGSLEATHSDAKIMCANNQVRTADAFSARPVDWKTDMAAHLRAVSQCGGWNHTLLADPQHLQSNHTGSTSMGAQMSCSYARAEFKKQVSRTQLMRSSSANNGIPGSVQLAAALRAAPDCSSPHAMNSAATAAMLIHEGHESGGSGSAVCGSSDVSGTCTADRRGAGKLSTWENSGAELGEMAGVSHWATLAGVNGSLARDLGGKGLVNSTKTLPSSERKALLSVASGIQGQEKLLHESYPRRDVKQVHKVCTSDSLQLLADVREQEDAAVGLLCLRHHPEGLGGAEPGFWRCTK